MIRELKRTSCEILLFQAFLGQFMKMKDLQTSRLFHLIQLD